MPAISRSLVMELLLDYMGVGLPTVVVQGPVSVVVPEFVASELAVLLLFLQGLVLLVLSSDFGLTSFSHGLPTPLRLWLAPLLTFPQQYLPSHGACFCLEGAICCSSRGCLIIRTVATSFDPWPCS